MATQATVTISSGDGLLHNGWTNVAISSKLLHSIHMRAISQEVLLSLLRIMILEITLLRYSTPNEILLEWAKILHDEFTCVAWLCPINAGIFTVRFFYQSDENSVFSQFWSLEEKVYFIIQFANEEN